MEVLDSKFSEPSFEKILPFAGHKKTVSDIETNIEIFQ
jgi:hypothetical protein